ncbi:MAG: hypothetical protein WDN03_02910 [Rhizomicrobium sp.]
MLTAAPAAAAGNPDFACKLRETAAMYDSLKALPPPLARMVQTKLGPIAERGAFYNATDVIQHPGPSRRFIRAGTTDHRRWFVWYEQGGIAYFKAIVVFADVDGKGLRTTTQYSGGGQDDLCAATEAILNKRPRN